MSSEEVLMSAKSKAEAEGVKNFIPIGLTDDDIAVLDTLLKGSKRKRSTFMRQAFRFYADHLLEKTAA
jgi:cobalamin-dependent methionine synthase I